MKQLLLTVLVLATAIGSSTVLRSQTRALPDSLQRLLDDPTVYPGSVVNLALANHTQDLGLYRRFVDAYQEKIDRRRYPDWYYRNLSLAHSLNRTNSKSKADEQWAELVGGYEGSLLDDSTRSMITYQHMRRSLQNRLYDQVDSLATIGTAEARRANHSVSLLQILTVKGAQYFYKKQFDLAKQAFEEVLGLAEMTNDANAKINALGNLSFIYEAEGDYAQALDLTYQIEPLVVASKKYTKLHNVYTSRALLFNLLQNYEQAISTLEKAKQNAERLENLEDLGYIYSALASNYGKLYRFDEATVASDSALQIARRIGDTNNLAIWEAERANIIKGNKQYEEALKFVDSAINGTNPRAEAKIRELNTLRMSILVALERWEEALQLVEELKQGDKDNYLARDTWVYQAQAKTLAHFGRYKEAYEDLNVAVLAKDSMNSIANRARIARAEEAEAVKEREVALARSEAELTIAEATLKNRTIIGGLIGLLAILGLLGWWTNRKRLREKELLNAKLAQANTALAESNAQLETSHEKIATLNREVNHRAAAQVKLAVDLIGSQIRELDWAGEDPRVKNLLEVSKTRLQALGVVNRQLSGRPDKEVDSARALRELVEAMRESSPVAYAADLELQPATLPAEVVTYVALILNELITNSVKYAFTDVVAPRIHVTTRRTGDELHLTYRDNGPGKSAEVRGTGHGSGLLAKMIRQLYGRAQERNDNGYLFNLQIPIHHAE